MLTEKEKVVLALWICGQTAKQSASYLGKSNRTVEFHREKVKCKLGVYCASELRIKVLESSEFNSILQLGMNLILRATNKFKVASAFSLVNSRNKIYSEQRV
ncbi:MAG: helix-turn-helix transcriptional regulator [Gammaproteobacteria bacterium]